MVMRVTTTSGTAGVQPRATLADVARLAGVSAKTVSRVMAGSENVAPGTRQEVLAAARRLRFRPNDIASSLRRGSVTTSVGFVIGDLTNPFYFSVAAGIERELAAQGLIMILAATDDDPGTEERVVGTLLKQRVRALIMVPIADDQSYLDGERQLGTPLVFVDRPPSNLAADTVTLDNQEGTAAAVRALTAIGHRKIAFVCRPGGLYTHQQRLAGYRQALREVGVTDTKSWERTEELDGPTEEESVRELIALPDPPTAIIAGNNKASAGVLRALGDRRDEFAFIGFDDFDFADTAGLTVVAHDPVELGRQAARLALQRLDNPNGPTQTIHLPTVLVRRGSGERPPRAG
jgi:LacI family transcriptional regulator